MSAAQYEEAAAKGSLDAMVYLAKCCEASDASRALSLYNQAADRGHADALCALGQVWEKGLLGCSRDAARAVELYRRAAVTGHARGLRNWGICLLKGVGGNVYCSVFFNEVQQVCAFPLPCF